jgi:hypothetical protein
MASEVIDPFARAESGTLRAEEARLRAYLLDRLHIRTRFVPLPDVRAILVTAPGDDAGLGLIVSNETTVAERIYLYVHLAAHVALGHHRPLDTIVEGVPGVVRLEHDSHAHGEAERLARAMWWGGNEDLAAPRRVRGSTLLRGLLARTVTRSAMRGLLLAMRAAYYDLRIERALAKSRLAAWLRDALCVTAVVSVAPQLSD